MSNVSKAILSLKSRALRYAKSKGQTLVEYALIIAIISVVAIGAMVSLGQNLTGAYSGINSKINSGLAASH
jgi:Flp pilus assembly pilin Flp